MLNLPSILNIFANVLLHCLRSYTSNSQIVALFVQMDCLAESNNGSGCGIDGRTGLGHKGKEGLSCQPLEMLAEVFFLFKAGGGGGCIRMPLVPWQTTYSVSELAYSLPVIHIYFCLPKG